MSDNSYQNVSCAGLHNIFKFTGDATFPHQVLNLDNIPSVSTSGSTKGLPIKLDGTQYYVPIQTSVAKFDYLSITTPGVVEASKAIVTGANKNIDTLVIADGGLKLGSGTGTAVTSTAAELNTLATVVAGTVKASKAVVAGATANLVFPKTSTIRVADWVASAALGSAVPFTTSLNIYSDGQLDILGVYGESTADLTSAYSAKCGRFRHVINGITCNHEAYGLIGQVVAKNVTYGHLHAGLMGTFEVNTAATVSAGDGLGCAGIISRIGGATITVGATGFLAGVISGQLASTVSITSGGVHAAFACRKLGAGITWAEALHIEDALVAIRFKAADNSYAHGIKAIVDAPDTNTTHALKVMIGTTAGYIPVYANETFGV